MDNILKNKIHSFETEWIVYILILLTLVLRLAIYYTTSIFSFSDYGSYISVIERISSGDKVLLQNGNCLFAISYMGYFAKYILGSPDYFYLFNCIAGTLSSLIIYYILKNTFHSLLAGLLFVFISMIYTEFLTFSAVFYTPVIMILLLSIFVILLSSYYNNIKPLPVALSIMGLIAIFLTTFFFKPELLFFPIFLIVFSLFFVRKDKIFMFRSLVLAFVLFTSQILFNNLHIITQPYKNVVSSQFVFFGHTNYGGDGGEGDFVYSENESRYNRSLEEWCTKNGITKPSTIEINRFQRDEVLKFITKTPLAWLKLQGTKFFRTFGVVPETTSFKILYTGLLKGNLWLTSIVVVVPVALVILMFICIFNLGSIRKLLKPSTIQHIKATPHTADSIQDTGRSEHFFYVYFLLFFYYLIASIFFGQYQERYRLPIMVVFIIPILSYFVATFDKKNFFSKVSLSIKIGVIMLFLVIWMLQVNRTISNVARLDNFRESIKVTK